jgi:4'-phosphopantetheinyl transferase EntD
MDDALGPRISSALAALFPPGVVVAETRGPGVVAELLPEEAADLGPGAVAKRAQEFAAGRACARRALREFRITGFPVRVGANREPLWPAGTVGSITHTEGLCAAVVGEASRFRGLGLDVEQAGRVSASLQSRICVPTELAWLARLPTAEASVAATLVFAVKEAFYKVQYPLARQWLYFQDAAVELPEWPATSGAWVLRPKRPFVIESYTGFPLVGRYRIEAGFVLAGVAIEQPAADSVRA